MRRRRVAERLRPLLRLDDPPERIALALAVGGAATVRLAGRGMMAAEERA
jgi:hypothetical protein